MKILVCEDDAMTLMALNHRLRQEGYDVVAVHNGLEAKQQLELGIFDLILTDLHMPMVDGLELIAHVRNQLKLTIPILMLTRVGAEEIVLKAFELGADDYVTKPFSPNELSIRIQRLMLKK